MIEIPTPKVVLFRVALLADTHKTPKERRLFLPPRKQKKTKQHPQLKTTPTDIPPEVQTLLDMERAKIEARFDGYEKDEQKIFGALRDVPGVNFLSNLLSRFLSTAFFF